MKALILFIVSVGTINAQQISSTAPDTGIYGHRKRTLLKISNMYAQPLGFNFFSTPLMTINDFKELAPNSILLQQNLSSYALNGNGASSGGDYYFFSAGITIKFVNKQRTAYRRNPNLRIDLSYVTGPGLACEETRLFNDTINETNGRYYQMNYYSGTQYRASASLIFTTKEEARFSVYGGIGMAVSITTNPYTEIQTGTINIYGSNVASGGQDSTTQEIYNKADTNEVFRNRTSYIYSAFLLAGIDFRLRKKKSCRMHLFWDFSYVVAANVVPELNPDIYYSRGFQVGLLGLKWTFK